MKAWITHITIKKSNVERDFVYEHDEYHAWASLNQAFKDCAIYIKDGLNCFQKPFDEIISYLLIAEQYSLAIKLINEMAFNEEITKRNSDNFQLFIHIEESTFKGSVLE